MLPDTTVSVVVSVCDHGKRREINLMRMPVDVDVDEHPAFPDGAEHLIREPFDIELLEVPAAR